MRVLVTNDDGIRSPGLWALARAISEHAEVLVVAPSRDMSGSAAAMMLRRPIKARKVKPPRGLDHLEAYAVNGPPGACALLVLKGHLGRPVELVVSGINSGPNLGRDTLLSGTVGATFIAAMEGLPSMAVSVAGGSGYRWAASAELAARLVRRLSTLPAYLPVQLNVNLPDLPLGGLAGVMVTHLAGGSCLPRLVVRTLDPRPDTFFLTTEPHVPASLEVGSDEWAVANGYVSITPLLPEARADGANGTVTALLEGLLESEPPVTPALPTP